MEPVVVGLVVVWALGYAGVVVFLVISALIPEKKRNK